MMDKVQKKEDCVS